MSSVTKQVLIIVKQQGLDQVNTSIKGLTSTTTAATKSTTGLGTAFQKGQGNALNLRTGVTSLDTSEKKAVGTTKTFTKETDKAAKSTGGLAAKFQGNKGLIFSTVGIATAGLEAVGMFQQYQNASAKVAEAQGRLNEMQELGITSGRDYENAQRDVTDAQRGQQFALRILTLSVGDLIPFTLLLINSAFKLKDTLGGAKTATDAATQATTALGNATRAASTGGMAQITTSARTATTGLTNMGNTSKLTNTAIGGLTTTATNFDRGLTTVNTRVLDATRLIGNNNSGLTGGYYGLSTGIDNSTKMSTKFKDAFTQIGASIKNLPNTFKSIGTSIASFFTNFGTHIGKLPGLFKAAGTAVLGFGKALLGLALNPIGLAIIGVSSAVLALATDFGGVRTAINNAGVAVGNAIPQLKGILGAIGGAANGALDYVAGMLGVETSSEKAAKKAESLGKLLQDPLVVGLQKVVKVGNELENLDNVVQKFDNVRAEIGKLSEGVASTNTVFNTFSIAIADVNVESENAKAQVAAFNKATLILGNSALSAEEKERLLNIALNSVNAALGEDINKAQDSAAANQKRDQVIQSATLSEAALYGGALKVSQAFQTQEREAGKNAQSMDENAKAVSDFALAQGATIPKFTEQTAAQKQFTQSLYEAAPLLQDHAKSIIMNADHTVNWSHTIQALAAEEIRFAHQAGEDWTLIGDLLQEGINGYFNAIGTIKAMATEDDKRAKQMQQALDHEIDKRNEASAALSEQIETALEGNKKVEESESAYLKKLNEKRESIRNNSKELGIWNEVQNLSTKDQETAIKITQDQNKVFDQTRAKIQEMASARGMDIEAIGQENTALLKFIQTTNTSSITAAEVVTVMEDLAATRLEDERASKVQNLAITTLLTSMNKSIPVIGMTDKGLQTLLQTYDDTANSAGIAADEIGVWFANLEKSQAVEKASVESLLALAEKLQIDIPEGTEMTIEGLKGVIETAMGMGDAVKKATDKALQAFEELTGNTKDALEGIISDALGEDGDEIKKAIKGLQKLDVDLNSFTAKQRIIDVFLNDKNFENDLQSLGETMLNEFGRMENFSKQEAQQIGDSFVSGVISEVGSKMPGLAIEIQKVWNDIKNDPIYGESGDAMLGALGDRLKNLGPIQQTSQQVGQTVKTGIDQGATGLENVLDPKITNLQGLLQNNQGPLQDTGTSLGQAVTTGIDQGASGMPQALNQHQQGALNQFKSSAPQFNTAGQQVGNEAVSGVSQALQAGKNEIANEAATNIREPVVQDATLMPGAIEGAIQPIEGVFSQSFLNASMAATGQINWLLADITNSFGFLVTNVEAKLTEISQAWITHGSNVSTIVGQISSTIATILTDITNFAGTAVRSLAGITATTTSTGNAFKTMGTSVSSGSSVGLAGVTNFTGIAGKGLGGIIAQAGSTGKAFTTMGSAISTAMSSAGRAAGNFASSFKGSMNTVKSSADTAKKSVDALQKSINALKSKSINIHVGLSGPGAAYLRHGGAFISPNPTGFAQTGTSFVNTKPRKIGGVNISEFGKPELVTVTPLSDPGNPMDKNISMSIPKPQAIPHHGGGLGGMVGGGFSGGQGQQPITVTGDLHVSVMMPDGQVLAKGVKPYLLSGFSGIT